MLLHKFLRCTKGALKGYRKIKTLANKKVRREMSIGEPWKVVSDNFPF